MKRISVAKCRLETEKSVTFVVMKRIFALFLWCIPYVLYAQGTIGGALNNLHQVQKGETLYSISRMYNISQEALLRANPDIKKGKVKRGEFLVIPEVAAPAPEVVTVPVADPVKRTAYETLRVGVFLPLEDTSARGEKVLEFYRGLLMAVDSVKRQGVNVEMYTLHCGHTSDEMLATLHGNDLDALNVAFGPADTEQVAVLADYCRGRNCRLVLPFQNTQPAAGFPLQYTATSSNFVVQREAARLVLRQFDDCNFVLLRSNDTDQKGDAFTSQMQGLLEEKGVSMRVVNIDGDEMAWESALNQFRKNIIIPDNTSQKTLNVVFSRLNAFLDSHASTGYRVSLLGYPEWQTYTGQLAREFYRYDTYFYTPYYRNPLSKQTTDFEQRYQALFRKPMSVSFPRYGMMGFDMGYYFLRGLSRYGDFFEQRQGEMQLQPVQHPFRFVGGSGDEGYTNRAIQLVHYTPDQKVEQIR